MTDSSDTGTAHHNDVTGVTEPDEIVVVPSVAQKLADDQYVFLHKVMSTSEAHPNFVNIELKIPLVVSQETVNDLKSFTQHNIAPGSIQPILFDDLIVNPGDNATKVRMKLIDLATIADYFSVNPDAKISDDMRYFIAEIMRTIHDYPRDVSVEMPVPPMNQSGLMYLINTLEKTMDSAGHDIDGAQFVPGKHFQALKLSYTDFHAIQFIRGMDEHDNAAKHKDSYLSVYAMGDIRNFDTQTFLPGDMLADARKLLHQYYHEGVTSGKFS